MVKTRPNSRNRSATVDLSDDYLSKNGSQDSLFISKDTHFDLIEYLKDIDRESLECAEEEIQVYKKEFSNLSFKIKQEEKNYYDLNLKYNALYNNYDKLLKIINYLNINVEDVYNILNTPDTSELTLAKFCLILPSLNKIIISENSKKSNSLSKNNDEKTILSSIDNRCSSENSLSNRVVFKRSLTELYNKENIFRSDLIKDEFACDTSIHINDLSHSQSTDDERSETDKNQPQNNITKELNKKTLKNKKKRLRKKLKNLLNSTRNQELIKKAKPKQHIA